MTEVENFNVVHLLNTNGAEEDLEVGKSDASIFPWVDNRFSDLCSILESVGSENHQSRQQQTYVGPHHKSDSQRPIECSLTLRGISIRVTRGSTIQCDLRGGGGNWRWSR